MEGPRQYSCSVRKHSNLRAYRYLEKIELETVVVIRMSPGRGQPNREIIVKIHSRAFLSFFYLDCLLSKICQCPAPRLCNLHLRTPPTTALDDRVQSTSLPSTSRGALHSNDCIRNTPRAAPNTCFLLCCFFEKNFPYDHPQFNSRDHTTISVPARQDYSALVLGQDTTSTMRRVVRVGGQRWTTVDND